MRRFFGRAAGAMLAIGLAFAPAAAGAVDITFVLANDTDRIDVGKEAGGFARLAAAVKAERAKGGNVIFAHAGDAISPSVLSGIDKGAHIVDLLNAIGPDVFVPGNHEFDFGPDVFRERMGEARFPVLSANLRQAGGRPFEGFSDTKMFEFEGVKVGILGVTDEDAREKSTLGDIEVTPAAEAAEAAAARLREAGADLVVAVAHVDRGLDRDLMASGNFDVILSGDDHDLLLNYDGRAVLAEGREQALHIPVVTLTVNVEEKDGRRGVTWRPGFRVIDTATVEPDPTVAEKVAAYERQLDVELNVPIGRTATRLDSRRATVRGDEAAIGNLVADAMRAAVDAEVAITNGGGIRGDTIYEAGTELTRRDILAELPFGNRTVKLEVAGETIWQALENGLSEVEEGAGKFPQVSGMVVEVDLERPAGRRVRSVTIGGEPIDPTRTYTLATNDFLARGGDGYIVFTQAKELLPARDADLMANDVMEYIGRTGEVAANVEGRLKAVR